MIVKAELLTTATDDIYFVFMSTRPMPAALVHGLYTTIPGVDQSMVVYVAAKATYIRLLHGNIGILEGFLGPSSVHRGRTHIVLG